MKEIIVIGDDELEDGTVTDCPLPTSPRHRTTRTPSSSKGVSEMRGCWPFKRKNSIQRGQSSGGDKLPVLAQHQDPYIPINMNNATSFNLPVVEEPIQLSQYRLSQPQKKTGFPSLNQCAWCLQDISMNHRNFMPLMPMPADPSSDDEDAVEEWYMPRVLDTPDPDEWMDWWHKSFDTPPHRK